MPEKAEKPITAKSTVAETIEGIIDQIDADLHTENRKFAARNTKVKRLGRSLVRGIEEAVDVDLSEEHRKERLTTTRHLLESVRNLTEVAELKHDEDGEEILSLVHEYENGVVDELNIRKNDPSLGRENISLVLSRNGTPIGISSLGPDVISWEDPQLPPRDRVATDSPQAAAEFVKRDLIPLMPGNARVRD